jgi:hypothetical protein
VRRVQQVEARFLEGQPIMLLLFSLLDFPVQCAACIALFYPTRTHKQCTGAGGVRTHPTLVLMRAVWAHIHAGASQTEGGLVRRGGRIRSRNGVSSEDLVRQL